jgi:hypothetical protein
LAGRCRGTYVKITERATQLNARDVTDHPEREVTRRRFFGILE